MAYDPPKSGIVIGIAQSRPRLIVVVIAVIRDGHSNTRVKSNVIGDVNRSAKGLAYRLSVGGGLMFRRSTIVCRENPRLGSNDCIGKACHGSRLPPQGRPIQ
jgi:hypothetical protein